ncbi:hypothetical protein BGX33_005973 [Mortierella sp. NVP41]|nr:hypothetical protein BGX33_005973 [Mortierella sp. NVP41]
MARKLVRHSILAALALAAACSAPPPYLLSSLDLSSSADPTTTSGSGLDSEPSWPTLDADPSDNPPNATLGSFAGFDRTGFFDDPVSAAAPEGGFPADPNADPSSLLLSVRGGDGDDLDTFAPPTQTVPTQTVHLASETEVTPTTGVFPNLIFQPAIQLYDPLVNNYQTYGAGPAYTSGYAGGSAGDAGGGGGGLGLASFQKLQLAHGSGLASFKKRQLAGDPRPMGPQGPGGAGFGGPGGPEGPGGPGGPGGPYSTIVNGAPTDVSTDTLIRPIVNIQPHALTPIPVPVSAPYEYPVPVGVSVPVKPHGPVGKCGKWDDCKWGGSTWGDWGGGGGWGDDCDWNWGGW